MEIKQFNVCPTTLAVRCVVGTKTLEGTLRKRQPAPDGYILVIDLGKESPNLVLHEPVCQKGRGHVTHQPNLGAQ